MWTKFVHHVTKLHHPDKKRKWQQSVFSQHNQRIIQKNISQSLLKRERKRVPLALVSIRALAINSKILSLTHTHIHSVVTLCFTHAHTCILLWLFASHTHKHGPSTYSHMCINSCNMLILRWWSKSCWTLRAFLIIAGSHLSTAKR